MNTTTPKRILSSIHNIDLQRLVNASCSVNDIMRNLGIYICGGNHKTVTTYMKAHNIDMTQLHINRTELNKKIIKSNMITQIPLCDILIENSKYHRGNLKRRLINTGIFKNVCGGCNQLPIWNGKPLTLQLHHINSVNDDNRIENLMLLCPNCHSQTLSTHSQNESIKISIRKKKQYTVIHSCSECNSLMNKRSKTGKCKKCHQKTSATERVYMGNRPNKEIMSDLIMNKSIVSISKDFNVSDNSVRKWLRYYDLPYKKADIDMWRQTYNEHKE